MSGQTQGRQTNNPPGPKSSQGPAGKPNTSPSTPDFERLSPVEREVWLAKQRVDEQRRMLRQVRARQTNASRQTPPPVTQELLDDLLLDAVQAEKATPQPPEDLAEFEDNQTLRFKPVALQPSRVKPEKKRPARSRSRRALDILGWTLEGLVVIAVLAVVGNWALQQAGISVDLFGGGQNANRNPATLSRAEGPMLNVMAEGEIYVPPTPTSAPATPTPVIPPTPTARPVLPQPTLAPAFGPTVEAPVVVAPSPTPFIVQAATTVPGKPKFAPPNRVVIPKLGLDQPVVDVTVDLGNWQVADYAVGHHQGTANAGDSSNMVLAGHRDIRGSVFLKLNELQPGDEIKVYSSAGVYRYIVTGTQEVAPTDISVMAPSTEATATLITCTPIGLATRRLVVKAKLVG